MRVALNLEQLLTRPPGGVGRYTAELARLLPGPDPDSGERIEVVPFVARHRRGAIDAALGQFGLTGIEPVSLLLPRPVLYDTWNTLAAPPLSLLHRELRDVDLVHAPSLAVPPRTGRALIVTVHDAAALLFPKTYPPRGRWFHGRGLAAAARRADRVIAPTQAAADEIVSNSRIPAERIRIVPHGVALGRVQAGVVAATRSTLGLGEEPYVLWVGTLEPRKNLPLLLDAFGAAVRGGIAERLVVVGPPGWSGAPRAIAAAASALGDRLVFTGPLRADRLAALYHGAELFVFPSLHEGFGLPVLEAMAQEVPVLCSDIPVLREVAGKGAWYVPPDDVGAWTDALVDLLGDDRARRDLGATGRARASNFTWERCIARTRAVYHELLGA
ncbi:MAG TPA: glycosyltransferase family 1 protein [Acidimicrobiia bacterium]|jgi:glycosyltransferase involved in cell wall biosynthesis|nr:glycosyltransferase family 1 protein [Acidimicrobiia bacterium]